jgi:hypothetical protein
VAHWKIVLGCVIWILIGITISSFAIKNSMTMYVSQAELQTQENSVTHANIRNEAVQNGNAEQLERLKGRLKKSLLDE